MIKAFVRHATSVNNVHAAQWQGYEDRDRVGGYQPNVELAPIGERQAHALGRIILPALSELLDHEVAVVRVSAGPSVRTRHTAKHLLSTMDPHMPVVINSHLHELRKGKKWLGGDEKRLRSRVETPRFHQRRAEQGWDFRHGRPVLNAMGLWRLHGGETARESATRIVTNWFEETPPGIKTATPGEPLQVDMAISHGLAGRYATAMLLHSDPSHPDGITMSVQEADRTYNMPNTSTHVYSPHDDGGWIYHGRIIVPEHMYV